MLVETAIDLAQAAEGVTVPVTYQLAVTCPTCNGSGAEPGTHPETCPRCGGSGRLQAVSSSVFGQFVRTQACPDCGGSGRSSRPRARSARAPARWSRSGRLTWRCRPGSTTDSGSAGRRRARGAVRRARRRPLCARPCATGPALRARRERHPLDARRDDDPGRARRDADRADARRRARARPRAGHAAGHRPRPQGEGGCRCSRASAAASTASS